LIIGSAPAYAAVNQVVSGIDLFVIANHGMLRRKRHQEHHAGRLGAKANTTEPLRRVPVCKYDRIIRDNKNPLRIRS
jgi:hypothetical protein